MLVCAASTISNSANKALPHGTSFFPHKPPNGEYTRRATKTGHGHTTEMFPSY